MCSRLYHTRNQIETVAYVVGELLINVSVDFVFYFVLSKHLNHVKRMRKRFDFVRGYFMYVVYELLDCFKIVQQFVSFAF